MARWFGIVVVLCVGLALTGCRRGDVTMDEQFIYATLEFGEQEVTDVIERALTGGARPLMQSAEADLRAGEVYVTGAVNRPQGDTANGTLRLSITASAGQVLASVTQLNFAGYNADTETLNRINGEIALALAGFSGRREAGAEITGITLTDSALTLQLRAPRQDRRP